MTTPTLPRPDDGRAALGGTMPDDSRTVAHGPPSNRYRAPHAIPGYRITEEVGRGGMGVVFKATQVSLGRVVAVKVLTASAHTPENYLRFRLEAETIARLRHPNIVCVHEVGEADGVTFCVLEYAAGGSLDRFLANGPPGAREAAGLVAKVARAVQAAHDAGVVHRDLKPANILLSESGEPLVGDFGLAKTLADGDGPTTTGQVMGTPSYMSPEQASGHNHLVGPASDVYALGAVLYACLVGRPPFETGSVIATLEAVRSRRPVPVRRYDATIPRDLETVVEKCLEKEPHRRYASAADLAADLERFMRGEAVVARRTPAVERLWLAALRRPTLAAAWVFGLLSALAVVAAFFLASAYREASAAKDAEAAQRRDAEDARRDESAARGRAEDAGRRESDARARLADLVDANNLVLAFRARAAGEAAVGRLALAAVTPAARGWDWGMADRLLHAPVEFRDAGGSISDLLFLGDGLRLVVAGGMEAIRVHDASTGKELAEWRPPIVDRRNPRPVAIGRAVYPQGLAALADGAVLANVAGASLVAFDPATGKPRRESLLMGMTPLSSVAAHPHLPHVAGGQRGLAFRGKGGAVRHRDTGESVAALVGHTDLIDAADYDPTGKHLATASRDGTARLWTCPDYRPGPVLRLHTGPVTSVAFRPGGAAVATGGPDGVVGLWSVPAGTLTAVVPVGVAVTALRWSPDGKALAVGRADGAVLVRDLDAGRSLVLWANTERGSAARSLAFRADGRVLATGCDDGTVRLHRADVPPEAAELSDLPRAPFYPRAYDPSTGSLYGTDSTQVLVRLRRAGESWAVAVRYPTPDIAYKTVRTVVAAPARGLVALGADQVVRVFDADSGRIVAVLAHHPNAMPLSVAFDDVGRAVVGWGLDGRTEVRTYDLSNGDEVGPPVLLPFRQSVVSPDGSAVLAYGGSGFRLRRRDGSGWVLADLNAATGVAWSADATFVTASDGTDTAVLRASDGGVVWRGRTDRPLHALVVAGGTRLIHATAGGVTVRELVGGQITFAVPPLPGENQRLWWDDAARALHVCRTHPAGQVTLTTYTPRRAALPAPTPAAR